ncbi:MAG: ATP-binding protein [Verrucomicrobiota bacterium]
MIERRMAAFLPDYLRQFPAVCVLGPRQVGKTTLVRKYAEGVSGDLPPEYLDLENPQDFEKLADARGYLEQFQDRLVILDEVQRRPGLFQVLRGLIDERRLAGQKAGHFVLLGSASIDLLQQSSETLAGRIAYLELSPLDILEAPSKEALWWRGGFPDSVLAVDDQASLRWREQFITTYLERDIPMLGPRIPATTLRRFWSMLAHQQGSLYNAAQMARNLEMTGKTVAGYLDLMVDLLLVRRLPPYHASLRKRLVKSPKVYLRDSGLLHGLLGIDSHHQLLGHPIVGMSWEGYVIENLLRVAPERTQASFYRTATGVELDLVLELPGNRLWAMEIKRSTAPKMERGLRQAIEDIQPDQTFLVYGGKERYPKGENIDVIGLAEMAGELAEGFR